MRLTRFALARFGIVTCHGGRDGTVTMVTLSGEICFPANERPRLRGGKVRVKMGAE